MNLSQIILRLSFMRFCERQKVMGANYCDANYEFSMIDIYNIFINSFTLVDGREHSLFSQI